ncbi:hypothetical protein AB0D49_03455 [Streptomyces sp. NPDC048290]|uniref:hypothetical protein n=1 Tax=Streptomyces sp. NPDC048290 TaxID=3155811 RepID=UPI003419EC51
MTNPLAGLFKARQREAARRDLFARSLRRCGEYLAAQGDPCTARQLRLSQAVGAFATALDGPSADPFDALLKVGERALETGDARALALALDLATAATGLRQRSKGAWRLHARTLDALGRDSEALTSYDRHLALLQSGGPAPETARRIDTLRRRRALLDEAVALFPGAGAPRLDQPAAALAPELAGFVRAQIDRHGAADTKVRRLTRLYGGYRRLAERDGLPLSSVGGTAPLGVTGLRALLDGRSVCVLSGGDLAAGQDAGLDAGRDAGLDAYDVVVRCDGVPGDPPASGARLDVHVLTLRGATPWEGPAWGRRTGVRLVFGDPAGSWRRAVRQRLVPGAQEYVGDASLRRPLTDPALLGESGWDPATTTTAFTVLRLLDFLDVSPRLDLIGPGLPGLLRPEEAAWVRARAVQADDSETDSETDRKIRIALR